VALGGSIGGALNALLCYYELPVPVGEGPEYRLAWHIVPAGAVHGAVLAAAACLAARWWAPRRLLPRAAGAVLVGWVAGYLSWNALSLSINRSWRGVVSLFTEGAVAALVQPLEVFGLVAAILWLSLVALRSTRSPGGFLVAAVLAGVLGSLRWWIVYQRWYFSLLHGAIWGLSVGTALWVAARRSGGAASAARRAA
jgi:hypothetical protein